MLYLVAYDIADPRRLKRVARFLERRALRCQKSVFLFRGDRAAVAALLEGLTPLLAPQDDVVQAWPLTRNPIDPGFVRGTPLPVQPASVVLAGRQCLFVTVSSPAEKDP
jgi:CRISPR-associated endonuclease Cas2